MNSSTKEDLEGLAKVIKKLDILRDSPPSERVNRELKVGDIWEDTLGHQVLIIQIDPYRNDFNYPVIGLTFDEELLTILRHRYHCRYPRYMRDGCFSSEVTDKHSSQLNLIKKVTLSESELVSDAPPKEEGSIEAFPDHLEGTAFEPSPLGHRVRIILKNGTQCEATHIYDGKIHYYHTLREPTPINNPLKGIMISLKDVHSWLPL